jgi:hypothetical protein
MIGDRLECQHYHKARLGHRVMLPCLSPGWRFIVCRLCWRFTRQLIPRLPVVRILIDPVKQLFAAWLFVLGRWGFLFARHSSWVASESGRQIVKLNGRCGALLPLFRLVGVRCIAALRRVEKPTASPQGSPELNSLALGRPQMPVQVSAPVRRGESLTGAKCWAVRFLRGRAAQHL